ncbi:Grx4 family monothiol glutaredoxin [Arenicella sp. 4NH20-0111]|uniref:Grx4 family monothiol glutaredoxin n=1 Tax=Arenicella sp. 4NH20-0111 TaxID=3127648 RepID=UPI00310974EA
MSEQNNTPETTEVSMQEQIKQTVVDNAVVLFMKGNANFPQCGFSGRAVQILQSLETEFVTVDVLSNDAVRQGIKDYSNWPTIPQLYVKGEFIGGSDIMTEMYESGELKDALTA